MTDRTGNHPLIGAEHRPPWWLSEVPSTGSTNADLVAAARSGAPDGTVLRADHQTSGRGRLDRRWEAPAGANLLVSLLFRRPHTSAHRLVRSVAVAARRAAAETCGVDVRLKWPNDLLVGDDKLGGILAEGVPGSADAVVVGLGLNIGWAPDGATSLVAHSPTVPTPRRMLLALLAELETCLSMEDRRLDVDYLDGLATIGRRVRVLLPGDRGCNAGRLGRKARGHLRRRLGVDVRHRRRRSSAHR